MKEHPVRVLVRLAESRAEAERRVRCGEAFRIARREVGRHFQRWLAAQDPRVGYNFFFREGEIETGVGDREHEGRFPDRVKSFSMLPLPMIKRTLQAWQAANLGTSHVRLLEEDVERMWFGRTSEAERRLTPLFGLFSLLAGEFLPDLGFYSLPDASARLYSDTWTDVGAHPWAYVLLTLTITEPDDDATQETQDGDRNTNDRGGS